MNDTSCIYWFSGTGNSLYAAKGLSAQLGDLSLAPMAAAIPAGPVGGKGGRIGLVFPSYYGNLPRLVRAFVEAIDIIPGTYIFSVVTMGALGQGSLAALDRTLRAKGLRLDYGRGIRMPANYVMKYDPADAAKCGKLLEKADKRIKGIAEDITARARSVRSVPVIADNLYKNIEVLDAALISNDACTGCGRCEGICPVQNIRISNGKPEWLHHCEHCAACISWCPAKAIEYGGKTNLWRRYRNPAIEAGELMRQNKEAD